MFPHTSPNPTWKPGQKDPRNYKRVFKKQSNKTGTFSYLCYHHCACAHESGEGMRKGLIFYVGHRHCSLRDFFRFPTKHTIESGKSFNRGPIVIVSFKCQLDWIKGLPDSWQALFLGVSMRVFLEETDIQISRLNKIPLTKAGGRIQPTWRPEWNTKGDEGQVHSVNFELRQSGPPALDAGTPGS